MMVRAHVGALALAVVVTAASTLALAGPGGPATCEPLAFAGGSLAATTQDDAYSGRDAGNSPGDAVLLSFPYSWGWLDPPADAEAGDLDDWYRLLLKGNGAFAMAEVNATVYQAQVEEASPHLPEALRFGLHVWAPGASAPIEGVPNDQGGTRVDFVVESPGTYLFHVFRIHDAIGASLCSNAYPPQEPTMGQNVGGVRFVYGVYFGCEPYCLAPKQPL